ncbi:HNH endonuclease [Actinomycetota bacterium]
MPAGPVPADVPGDSVAAGIAAGLEDDPVAVLRGVLGLLGVVGPAGSEGLCIDQIAVLEALKGAAAAAQARVTAGLVAQRAAREEALGVPVRQRCVGLGPEVALARKVGPTQGDRFVGLARALVHEMPHTLAHLSTGAVSEWTATALVKETAVLSVEHRAEVDARLADVLPDLSTRQATGRARAIAKELDQEALVARAARAESERRVWLTPKPEGMAMLSALLPMHEGVAAYAALRREAESQRAQGDPDRPGAGTDEDTGTRGLGQLCADLLVQRLTGQKQASGVPIEVQLVMPAETLLDGGSEPAQLSAVGLAGTGEATLAAPLALRLLDRAEDNDARLWLRRLFTSPDGTRLAGLDRRRTRFYRGVLRSAIRARDQHCRLPYCDSPIRHIDHITSAATGGATSRENAAGDCERHNHTKELPGWATFIRAGTIGSVTSGSAIIGSAAVSAATGGADEGADDGADTRAASPIPPVHAFVVRTPTGHEYASLEPPILPGRRQPRLGNQPHGRGGNNSQPRGGNNSQPRGGNNSQPRGGNNSQPRGGNNSQPRGGTSPSRPDYSGSQSESDGAGPDPPTGDS